MQGLQAEHRHHGRRGGDPEHAGAGRQADGRDHPDTGRRGQATDGILMENNEPRAQEAHAGDDLGRHAGRIETLRVAEAELGNHHEQGAAQSHQEVRADARLLGAQVTLQTDQGAQQRPDRNPEDHFTDGRHPYSSRNFAALILVGLRVMVSLILSSTMRSSTCSKRRSTCFWSWSMLTAISFTISSGTLPMPYMAYW